MLKILLVDDSHDDFYLAYRQLKKVSESIVVEWAESGEKALLLLKQLEFDCVLSDFQMPGMDGLELLKNVRDQGESIPFIFLTGQGNEEIAAQALRQGANDYFTKDIGFAHYDRLFNSISKSVKAHLYGLNKVETERALHESERKYRTLVECASDSIIIIQDSRIKFMNPRLPKIIGYSVYDVLDKPFIKFVCPEEQEKVDTYYQRLIAGDDFIVSYETQLCHKQGGLVDVEINASSIEFDGQKASLVFIHDITARKRAEARRLASEFRYKAIFESAGDAIFLMQGDKFIECNPKTLEIFACSRDDIIGKPPYDFSPTKQPDGRSSKEAACELIRRACDGEPLVFEWLHRRLDGTEFPAEVTLTCLHIEKENTLLAIVRDISDRENA